MKEKELTDFGFVQEFEYGESDNEFYYYVYELSNNPNFCLISSANDEVVDDEYFVEIFNEDGYLFKTIEDVKSFVDVLNKNKK